MTLENRIEKLENQTGDAEPRITIVYVREGTSEAERKAEEEKALADYKKEHPDWIPSSRDISIEYICVTSENAKKLTERVLAGEGT